VGGKHAKKPGNKHPSKKKEKRKGGKKIESENRGSEGKKEELQRGEL